MGKLNKIKQDGLELWVEMLIVAKIMKHAIGRTKLFKLLRDAGYLMEGNIPYQPFVDSKYFKMELRPRYDAKGQVVQWYAVTLASTKGIELIKKLVAKQKQEVAIETA